MSPDQKKGSGVSNVKIGFFQHRYLFVCLFVPRALVGTWRIKSVFAEFPKVLLSTMVCAQVPQKPRTPSTPHFYENTTEYTVISALINNLKGKCPDQTQYKVCGRSLYPSHGMPLWYLTQTDHSTKKMKRWYCLVKALISHVASQVSNDLKIMELQINIEQNLHQSKVTPLAVIPLVKMLSVLRSVLSLFKVGNALLLFEGMYCKQNAHCFST